ncbi:MAG: PadR family transcriptional regulator [Stenotrophomonas sp.]
MKPDTAPGQPRRPTSQRALGRGDLRLLLLSLINEQPRHGYELIQCISEMFVRAYTPSAGSVYPLLAQFEADGWARVHDDAGRKRYAITPAGRAALTKQDAQVQAALLRTRQSARALTKANLPQPVREAMQHLTRALMLRHGRWHDDNAGRVAQLLAQATALIHAGGDER